MKLITPAAKQSKSSACRSRIKRQLKDRKMAFLKNRDLQENNLQHPVAWVNNAIPANVPSPRQLEYFLHGVDSASYSSNVSNHSTDLVAALVMSLGSKKVNYGLQQLFHPARLS